MHIQKHTNNAPETDSAYRSDYPVWRVLHVFQTTAQLDLFYFSKGRAHAEISDNYQRITKKLVEMLLLIQRTGNLQNKKNITKVY
jgi:hypothetical protein